MAALSVQFRDAAAIEEWKLAQQGRLPLATVGARAAEFELPALAAVPEQVLNEIGVPKLVDCC
jgi:hypothetical protein